MGAHLIRTYPKTQATVAKSSGESELYAVARASAEGLGIAILLTDLGVTQRTGPNKVRHVEVDVLWLQEQQARRQLPIAKIPGPQNPSDLCAKNVPVALLERSTLTS